MTYCRTKGDRPADREDCSSNEKTPRPKTHLTMASGHLRTDKGISKARALCLRITECQRQYPGLSDEICVLPCFVGAHGYIAMRRRTVFQVLGVVDMHLRP